MKENLMNELADLKCNFNEVHKVVEWCQLEDAYSDCSKVFRNIEQLEKFANSDSLPVASIHRFDLESRGFDISNITDGQMNEITEKMVKVYFDDLFWVSMEMIAEDMNIPKKK